MQGGQIINFRREIRFMPRRPGKDCELEGGACRIIVRMERQMNETQRLFAVSSYKRAKDGNFTGARRISSSLLDVSNRVIQADAALRGILASLRAMREICASSLNGDATAEELAARNGKLDVLKGDISRLSESVAGTEFRMFQTSGGDAGELRRIDEAIDNINKMSGKIHELREVSDVSGEDCVLAWMRELFGD